MTTLLVLFWLIILVWGGVVALHGPTDKEVLGDWCLWFLGVVATLTALSQLLTIARGTVATWAV